MKKSNAKYPVETEDHPALYVTLNSMAELIRAINNLWDAEGVLQLLRVAESMGVQTQELAKLLEKVSEKEDDK